MTEERKTELLGSLVFWATEVINNDEDIIKTLHTGIGFSKKELEEFDVEIPDGCFGRIYPYISDCEDADYLFDHLSKNSLNFIESTLFNYSHDIISLVIPRDDNDEIDFDGEWRVEVKDNNRESTEEELMVLKWVEGFEDTGYLVEVLGEDNDQQFYEHKGGFGQTM